MEVGGVIKFELLLAMSETTRVPEPRGYLEMLPK
jgi:hypothetical protein